MTSIKLLDSFNCYKAIGNYLNINKMIEEIIRVFSFETSAVNAGFHILNNNKNDFTFIGNILNIDINNIINKADDNNIISSSYDKDLNKIIFKLEKVIIFFFYKKEQSLEEILKVYESFRKKINLSIEFCLQMKKSSDKNEELEVRILNEIKLNIEKEKQIQEQHKMVQMGELIGNIAQQWREPLSVISTAASGMKVKKELNMLEDSEFFDYTNNISKNVLFLSQTIDEFRDYIQASNKIKEVIIQDRVVMASLMVKQSFDLEQIEIIQEYVEAKPILYKIVLGELLQVLISIFNNAKEAFEGKNISNKWIKYGVYDKGDSILITIEDNAGGIDINVINKIFNLDFTTKSKKAGTGIGLYSGYNIVVNNLNGQFYVKNSKNGAKFYLHFPKNYN